MAKGLPRSLEELYDRVAVLEGGGGVEVEAGDVTVAAGDDGLTAGDLQAALQAIATRIQALEDAAV